MPPGIIFTIVKAGGVLVTVGLALLLFMRSRPKGRWLRGVLAVAAAWVSGIVYTIYVYNPAGIEAGRYAGMHFPESHFDNKQWVRPCLRDGSRRPLQ